MTSIFQKTISAIIVAATLGTTAIATSSSASAAWRHHGYHGGAVAAGVFGALALGMIAASAASPRECWIERRAITNRGGDVIGARQVRVCNWGAARFSTFLEPPAGPPAGVCISPHRPRPNVSFDKGNND